MYFTESSIINGIKKKDNKAFEALIDMYGERLLKVCYLILKDINLSQDVTQEVFIKVYKYSQKFKGKSSLYTWIYKIAVNQCRDELKKRKEYVTLNEIEFMKADENVEDKAINNIDKDTIKECIFSLNPIYREVLTLFYYENMSINEISDVLSQKENTIKSRLKRGREFLKERIHEEEIIDER
jgi:RNA polymerase sigma-70 factor, ECF subfamily